MRVAPSDEEERTDAGARDGRGRESPDVTTIFKRTGKTFVEWSLGVIKLLMGRGAKGHSLLKCGKPRGDIKTERKAKDAFIFREGRSKGVEPLPTRRQVLEPFDSSLSV